MATQGQQLAPDTPVNLVSALALGAGTYNLTNEGGRPIKIAEATNEPAVNTLAAHTVEGWRSWPVTVAGEAGIWVWCPGGAGAIAITPAS